MTYAPTIARSGSVPVVRLATAVPGAQPNFRRARGPHTRARGYSGTVFQSGQITSEEFNADLSWKEGIRTWDVMRRTEPQVFSTLLIMELPIRSAEWGVVPGTPAPRDLEIASFVETCYFHKMRRGFDDYLRHALLMWTYGFMPFEMIFRYEGDSVVLDDFAPRMPKTVYRWWVDDQNRLTGIQQWASANGRPVYVDIAADDLVLFTHRQEGQNYEGTSVLRTAYKPWWYKSRFERLVAVGYEREHVGIPVVTLPESYTNKDIDRGDKIGKNIRSHEQAYITLPPGWSVDWLKGKNNERKGGTMLEMMYYLDRQIQQNVLAQFLSLGTTDTGSYAMSNDQSSVFLMSLQASANYFAEINNRRPLRRLVDFNYRDVLIYPELRCRKIHAYNFLDMTTSIANLVSFGVIPVTYELEDFIYSLLGIPVPQKSVVESTNPVDGASRERGTLVQRADPAADTETDPATANTDNQMMHEVYQTEAYRLMDGAQRRIYERMARECVRPRLSLRLSAGTAFASAPTDRALTAERAKNHRLTSQIASLRAELDAADAELEETHV